VRDAIGKECSSLVGYVRLRKQLLDELPVMQECEDGIRMNPQAAVRAAREFEQIRNTPKRWDDLIVTVCTHDGSNYKNDQFHAMLIRDLSLVGMSQRLNAVIPVSIHEMSESTTIFQDHFGSGEHTNTHTQHTHTHTYTRAHTRAHTHTHIHAHTHTHHKHSHTHTRTHTNHTHTNHTRTRILSTEH